MARIEIQQISLKPAEYEVRLAWMNLQDTPTEDTLMLTFSRLTEGLHSIGNTLFAIQIGLPQQFRKTWILTTLDDDEIERFKVAVGWTTA